MINFTLSETGYVLAGTFKSRSFSEYWDIEIKPENTLENKSRSTTQIYLANITQI